MSFIFSPTFTGWFLVLKIAFIVFSLFLLGAIVFGLLKCSWLKFILFLDAFEFFTWRPFGVRKIVKVWNKITARLDTGLESEYKLAIIEADSMLDDILRRMGYAGETLEERLKNLTSATLPNIEEIKATHQVRNNIVHDPDYRLSLDDARAALTVFEQALRDLQAF